MLALFLWLRPPRQKAWRSGYSLKSQLQKQSGATATIPRRFSNIIIIVISKELFENEKSLIYTTCHFEGAFLATEKSLLYRKHQVSLRSLPMVWKYHTKQKCHFEGASWRQRNLFFVKKYRIPLRSLPMLEMTN